MGDANDIHMKGAHTAHLPSRVTPTKAASLPEVWKRRGETQARASVDCGSSCQSCSSAIYLRPRSKPPSWHLPHSPTPRQQILSTVTVS